MFSFLKPLHNHEGNILLASNGLFITGDEHLELPLSNIEEVYMGFDELFPASSVKNLGMFWQPIRIKSFINHSESQTVYLVINHTGFFSDFIFAFIQVGRTLFMLWASRSDAMLVRNFQRILVWLLASGCLWIAGGLAAPEHRLWFWLGALALEYVSPALYFRVPGLGRARTEDWTIEGGHMAERVGLFIIICLGETLLVSGATFAGLDW
ncbi:MAG: hypothetical protein EOP55_14910, partial [Sphingobacteriales bacterium]